MADTFNKYMGSNMNDTNDYVNERAGRFFNALANSKKVSVSVRTPVRQDIPVGFVRSMRAAIPALLLVTSAQAQTNTPTVNFSVNGQPAEKLAPLSQSIEQALNFSGQAAEHLPQVLKCTQDFYQENANYNADSAAFFLETSAQAIHKYQEIIHWAKTYGREVKLGVAAYCQNPNDWQGVVMGWDNNVERYRNTQLPDQAADYVLSRRAARADTMYAAIQYAAQTQAQSQTEGLVHKVNGFDWVRAATELAAGATSLLGARETANDLKRTERSVHGAQRVYENAKLTGSRQGPDRVEHIGRVMEQAARMQQLSPPRYRPQTPTY